MSTEPVPDFFRFALAFEDAFAARDWSRLANHVADDVVWIVDEAPAEIGGLARGRDACLSAIAASCDAFDHRFDTREPRILDGPTPIPGGVHLRWVVTYSRAGLPPFHLRGEEWDFFVDGRLELHRERIANLADAFAFAARHEASLRPRP
jgi:hypothetical protein